MSKHFVKKSEKTVGVDAYIDPKPAGGTISKK